MNFIDLLQVLDLMGVFVFAVSGAIVAAKKQMDILGMLVLAVATASGGGTLRAVLMGDTPVPFLRHPAYLLVCITAVFLVFVFYKFLLKLQKPMILFDALGLGLFMALGISAALTRGLDPWAALLMGVITASFGGVIRDILSAEVPLIFRSDFYATACLVGGVFYFLLQLVIPSRELLILLVAFIVFVVRFIAIKQKWSLPRVREVRK